ncbi:Type IV secretion protein Rhs [Pseudomonas syringae pv. cilantro]|uniref:Type IV secretion protein Rhs n=1 Tax=Pseudomonas syringae pv. cilantro TaxID=81035 RepID=A0A0N0GFG7_PSESX|nr:Type IV secretion protein Rhs [Pseudomonas syringae pv. cilantro]
MFASAHQPRFSLSIDCSERPDNVDHGFQILAFTGHEAINQPFCFTLELVSERLSLDLERLLGLPAFLQFGPNDRGVHGLIDRIAQGDSGTRLTHIRSPCARIWPDLGTAPITVFFSTKQCRRSLPWC